MAARSSVPPTSLHVLHHADAGTRVSYDLLRLGSREVISLQLAPIPTRQQRALLHPRRRRHVHADGRRGVRLRRPRDQATLHFFWLCLAFFGTFTFSFSGRLDRLDWVFYWADACRSCCCRRCSCTSRSCSPNGRAAGCGRRSATAVLPLLYVPAAIAGPRARGGGGTRAARRAGSSRACCDCSIASSRSTWRCASPAASCVLMRAFADVRSVTARRQLRWIVWGTALGAVPVRARLRAAVRARRARHRCRWSCRRSR